MLAQDTKAQGTVVRASALIAVPWANGGGHTRIITDTERFRLSLATIAGEGPFSTFPGLIRHFALVEGKVELSLAAHALDATAPPLTFAGTVAVYATPLNGPALALNLMVPVDRAPLRLERCEGAAGMDVLAVFAIEPVIAAGMAMAAHDTLFPTGPVDVSGRALVVR